MELTPKIHLFGLTFDVAVMIATVVTCVVVFLIAVWGTRGRDIRPTKMQNFVEMLIDFIRGVTRTGLDQKTAEKYVGFAFTLFLFMFVANQLGLILNISTEAHHAIPALGIEEGKHYAWWKSPTADINIPVVMAVTITLFAHYLGIRSGAKRYVKHYFEPFAPMVVMHIIDEIAKPVTHALRLWGNIFAGEVLILIMVKAGVIGSLPLLPWLAYSLFVGTVQAYVFTVLAIVYIGQKVAHDH
jgi:F-type H+-transporting ATPase subunit a